MYVMLTLRSLVCCFPLNICWLAVHNDTICCVIVCCVIVCCVIVCCVIVCVIVCAVCPGILSSVAKV